MGKLPYPVGTLVVDAVSERTGCLMWVLEERTKEKNRLLKSQAFMRPPGGGIEWDVPLEPVMRVEEPER
ncbi:hypothetical protein [Streptomyces tsukubensis]|uniref:hypothetical protein n=1 Tax=Streptomyces tsukubensis TaxID=83656 RepID=UPI001D04281F|nr:hypothetical protein [Streptomyces tsukubensis]